MKSLLLPGETDKKTASIILIGQVIIFLIFWNFFTSEIVPKPHEVIQSFYTLWMNGLGTQLASSFLLSLEAILLAAAISLLLNLAALAPIAAPFKIALTKGRFLGLIGFSFLFIVVFGLNGHNLKLGLLTFGTTVFLGTSINAIFDSVTKAEYDYARTLKLKDWRMIYEIIILGKSAEILDAVRQNFAICWTLLTAVEQLVRSDGGIGILLVDSNKYFKLADVFALQLSIVTMGLTTDFSFKKLIGVICPYSRIAVERK